jgi:hypothetical protein
MKASIVLAVLLAVSASAVAKPRFVFEERPGRTYEQGDARWRDALLRASVGGCKERLPRGSRLRSRIRDCVVNQVHVTNLSPYLLECRVIVELPAPDDDGRRRIEHTVHIAPNMERWVATMYGPTALVPANYETRCAIVRS